MNIYIYIYGHIYPLYIVVYEEFDTNGNLSLASKIVRIRIIQEFDLCIHEVIKSIS